MRQNGQSRAEKAPRQARAVIHVNNPCHKDQIQAASESIKSSDANFCWVWVGIVSYSQMLHMCNLALSMIGKLRRDLHVL